MNLAPAIRFAILQNPDITSRLGNWKNEPCVFTRRPAPTDAEYPMILISPDIASGNTDGLTSMRPTVVRYVQVYGENTAPMYRRIEEIGYLLRDLFHRQRLALDVQAQGYRIISLVAVGPTPTPVDDEKLVGRMVTLTVSMQPTG